MCSSAKSRTTIRTITCSTLAGDMEYAEYAAMIRRSNAGIARREAQQAHLKSQKAQPLNREPSRVRAKAVTRREYSFFTGLQRLLSGLLT